MYREQMLLRWRRQWVAPELVAKAILVDPFEQRIVRGWDAQRVLPRPVASCNKCRMILNFHFVWESAGLRRIMRTVLARWSGALLELGFDIGLDLAWRGAARPLGVKLRLLRNHRKA